MPRSKAATGVGAQFFIGAVVGSTGTEVFTKIGEVTNFKFSGSKKDIINVTSTDSTAHEKIGSLTDYGQADFTINYVPADAGQIALLAAWSAVDAYDFKITLAINRAAGQSTAGDTITFAGIVSSGNDYDIDVTKAQQISIKVDITGAVARVTGS